LNKVDTLLGIAWASRGLRRKKD